MGQETGSQKARPEVSRQDLSQPVKYLRMEIAQNLHQLEAAKARGDYAGVIRIKREIQLLRESLENWVRLMRSLDETEEDEE